MRNIVIDTNAKAQIKEARKKLGGIIRNSREAKNFSQDGLAKLVGMERQQIYRIENGLTGTTPETILNISKALEIEADPLLALVAGIDAEISTKPPKPRNFPEFLDALESLGVVNMQMLGGYEVFRDFTEDDYQFFLEKMINDLQLEVKRKNREKK